ncbi:MAG TPA: EpsG family protein [Methylophaga aminisulfidivorans]|uniref:EpsG family protein n=1 Tax=Methylophaga TaxID=40222 RepID=UPI0017587038|nr:MULTISPECIES: EpsG family protein [Methylophaga]HIC45277.1 EpsG family protein [Methylophaga sp.]HIM40883.1 EpsG family protein [Methylophaga aminisulfidivorans]
MNNKIDITIKYAVFIALSLIAVYLCQTASRDWINYQWLFSLDTKKSWGQIFSEISIFKEPIYFLITKLGGEIIGFSLFMAILTIVTLVTKLHYLSKIVKPTYVVCFFYICSYFLLLDTTALRVAYALAFTIPGFYYLQKKQVTLSIILVGLASQVHLTTILFIIIYPLYFIRYLNFVVFGIFVLSPVVIWINFSVFEWLVQFSTIFTDKYAFYAQTKLLEQQNSTGLYFYFIGFYYLLVASIYFYLRDDIFENPFKNVMASLAMLGVIVMCLFHDNVAIGARLGELLLISTVFLLSWVYLKAKAHKHILIQLSLLVVFLMYAIARFIYLFPNIVSI